MELISIKTTNTVEVEDDILVIFLVQFLCCYLENSFISGSISGGSTPNTELTSAHYLAGYLW
jgi:hypothetical protein